MQRADLDYDAKNPIFIPKVSKISKLIIIEIHISNGHCGRQQLIATINLKYWIPNI
uniref:Integrase_H2C2 domain-containing protein n=1 Tax=Heterorhabditis bacteriophora TaxID=37862 RepID=A0A1I7WGM1_HETBA